MPDEEPLTQSRERSPKLCVQIEKENGDEAGLVEQVVLRLNSICRSATFDFSLSVGELIINAFYAGDLTSWRRRGRKSPSLRMLAKHPGLPMSPAALYRSVAIYELCHRLGLREWKHVSTSHLRAVLPLHFEEQSRLLAAAESGRWPVRRLENEAGLSRSKKADGGMGRGGRKRLSRTKRIVRKLETCLNEVHDLLGVSDTLEPSAEKSRSLLSALQQVRYACVTVEARLYEYLSNQDNDLGPTPTNHDSRGVANGNM